MNRKQADPQAARELLLYLDSDADLYRQQFMPIIENLARKIAKGKYDAALVPKLWRYLADNAAKKYAREFSNPGDEKMIFTPATREIVARELAEREHEKLVSGEYSTWLASKGIHLKKNPKRSRKGKRRAMVKNNPRRAVKRNPKGDFHEIGTFTHEGRDYSAGGAARHGNFLVAYLAKDGIATTWDGKRLGTYRILSTWKTPRSFISSTMSSVQVTLDGSGEVFSGRSAGVGMIFKGKLKGSRLKKNPRRAVKRRNPKKDYGSVQFTSRGKLTRSRFASRRATPLVMSPAWRAKGNKSVRKLSQPRFALMRGASPRERNRFRRPLKRNPRALAIQKKELGASTWTKIPWKVASAASGRAALKRLHRAFPHKSYRLVRT